MTWDAYCLEVAVIIGAALGDIDDVVNLKVFGRESAYPAGVVITDQDRLTFAAPGATTTA
ncbi:hypothetical protein BK651_00315 [Pseudomonas rhodesiae]|nr:hypothetical protein BK650_05725 [Pseudomonas rhodesiae]ROM67567.1 hypothetical protein BK651_00315 [Pseudomonas rhodesiae]